MHLPTKFAELPWPIRWLLMGGGGLVSAFASRLPEAWQDLGLYSGLTMIAIGVLATAHHHINIALAKNGISQIQLSIPHFIIIGLLVALGWIGWRLHVLSSTSAAPATVAVAPSLQAPAFPKQEPFKPRLTAYDVEQRERAIDQLLELLNPKLTAIAAQGASLSKMMISEMQNGTAVDALNKYADKARAAVTEYFEVAGRFQSQFPDIYLAAVASDWNPIEIAGASDQLISQIQQIQTRGQSIDIAYLIQNNKYWADWQQVTNGKTWTWINLKQTALTAKRREYEQAEVYPK